MNIKNKLHRISFAGVVYVMLKDSNARGLKNFVQTWLCPHVTKHRPPAERFTAGSLVCSSAEGVLGSIVAGQIVLGGPTCPSETYGGSRENPLKLFEIFIHEIATNASNFKN